MEREKETCVGGNVREYMGRWGEEQIVAGDGAGRWVRALGKALLTFHIKGSPRYLTNQNLRVIQVLVLYVAQT